MSRSINIRCQGRREILNRRDFLRLGAGAAAMLVFPPVFAKTNSPLERELAFYNTHTGETLKTAYWSEGNYLHEALQDIDNILRDHRSGEVHQMDKALLDLLYALRSLVDSKETFHIISGYRSPATNAMLNKRSSGVAKRSYHMQGKAIDIRLPGTELKQLHRAALAMKAGGVGCYTSSDFIHVDVGPVRTW
jgi:uncharacterized protein YcbK (DUF882 family)